MCLVSKSCTHKITTFILNESGPKHTLYALQYIIQSLNIEENYKLNVDNEIVSIKFFVRKMASRYSVDHKELSDIFCPHATKLTSTIPVRAASLTDTNFLGLFVCLRCVHHLLHFSLGADTDTNDLSTNTYAE